MYKNDSGQLIFENDFEVANYVSEQMRRAEAHEITSQKLNACHEYVQKNCMPEGWGKNVWHTLLQDAIDIRKVYQPSEHAWDTDNICYKCGLEKANVGKYCRN